MSATDHAVMEAAVRAKRAQQQRQAGHVHPTPKPASAVNKAITAGIWVAAAGSLAAVMLA